MSDPGPSWPSCLEFLPSSFLYCLTNLLELISDRLAKIKQAEEALLNQCMEEFEKGDVEEIVDDLVEKLFFSDKK